MSKREREREKERRMCDKKLMIVDEDGEFEDGKFILYTAKKLNNDNLMSLSDKLIEIYVIRTMSKNGKESTQKRIDILDKKKVKFIPKGACWAIGPQESKFVCPSGVIIQGSITNMEIRLRNDLRRSSVERVPVLCNYN